MKSCITKEYQPNDEVLGRLNQDGVDRDFALSLVPEFVIYWQERGYKTHSWNSKFLTHAKYEWRRYEIMLAHGRAYFRMGPEWTPNKDVLWALAEQQIPEDFTMSVLPEFRIYWMDQGLVTNSWNSKFIGHVRFRWQHHLASQQVLNSSRPIRQQSIADSLTDREWAQDYRGGRNGNC